MKTVKAISLIAALALLQQGDALGQAQFIEVGDTVNAVARDLNGEELLFPFTLNDAAIAVNDDGVVVIGYQIETSVNGAALSSDYFLRAFDADGRIDTIALGGTDSLSPQINSPTVFARADGTFVGSYMSFAEGAQSGDVATRLFEVDAGGGEINAIGDEVLLSFSDTQCLRPTLTTNQASNSGDYLSSVTYLQICTDSSFNPIHAAHSQIGMRPNGEFVGQPSEVTELVSFPREDGQPPATAFEFFQYLPSTTTGTDGRIFAAYSTTVTENSINFVRPVLVEMDEQQSPLSSTILNYNTPFSQLFGVCGHEDVDYLWMSLVNEDQQATLLRIADGVVVDEFVLGSAMAHGGSTVTVTDVACDPWGNAVVTWISTDEMDQDDTLDDVDAIRVAVVTAVGELLGPMTKLVPLDNFALRSAVSISPSGQIALAWTTFTEINLQQFELSGHIATDGTQSGSFFSPFFNGEGYVFDIVEIDGQPTIVVYYFTYLPDGSGKQAWLVGSAPIIDNLATVEVGIGSGATFGDAFNPADVTITPSGTLTVRFIGCGLVKVTTDSGTFGPQEYIAQNLTGVPLGVNGICSDALAPDLKDGSDTKVVDATQGGSVFTPARNGEGFIFDVVNVGGVDTLVIYYFTYQPDGSGEMAWIVGSGPIDQATNSAVATVAIGEGATFGAAFDPNDVIFTEWGTITVTWISCDEILVEYDGLWGMGSFTVQALTPALIGATGNCQ